MIMLRKLFIEKMPALMEKLEKLLSMNGTGYLVGNKVSCSETIGKPIYIGILLILIISTG